MRYSLAGKLKLTQDNHPVIMEVFNKMKPYDTMYLPAGLFPTYNMLDFTGKAIYIECANEGTEIAPCTGNGGLRIKGTTGLTEIKKGKLIIRNHFSDYRENGPKVQDRDMGMVGVEVFAQVWMEGVTIQGFYGSNLVVSGEVTKGSNASGSIFFKNLIGLGWRGVWTQGGDANSCLFLANDIRDNYEKGIVDGAMIENKWNGNMLHMNKAGNIESTSPWSNWWANYSEGSMPDKYDGSAKVTPGAMTDHNMIELTGGATAFMPNGEIWTEQNGHGPGWWKKKSAKKMAISPSMQKAIAKMQESNRLKTKLMKEEFDLSLAKTVALRQKLKQRV